MTKAEELVQHIIADKSPEEQVRMLMHMLLDHALTHPWVDDELQDSMLVNIARDYKVPFKSDSAD